MDDGQAHHKVISQIFSSASNKATITEFISLEDLLNYDIGYVKVLYCSIYDKNVYPWVW